MLSTGRDNIISASTSMPKVVDQFKYVMRECKSSSKYCFLAKATDRRTVLHFITPWSGSCCIINWQISVSEQLGNVAPAQELTSTIRRGPILQQLCERASSLLSHVHAISNGKQEHRVNRERCRYLINGLIRALKTAAIFLANHFLKVCSFSLYFVALSTFSGLHLQI